MVFVVPNPAARIRRVSPGGVPGADFPVEHGGEVFLVGPACVPGLVTQAGCGLADPWGLQCFREVVELLTDRCCLGGWGGLRGGHDAMSMLTPNAAS